MISRLMKDLVAGGYLAVEDRTIVVLPSCRPPGSACPQALSGAVNFPQLRAAFVGRAAPSLRLEFESPAAIAVRRRNSGAAGSPSSRRSSAASVP